MNWLKRFAATLLVVAATAPNIASADHRVENITTADTSRIDSPSVIVHPYNPPYNPEWWDDWCPTRPTWPRPRPPYSPRPWDPCFPKPPHPWGPPWWDYFRQ